MDMQNYQRDSIGIYTQINNSAVQNIGTAIFKEDIMVGHLSSIDTICHLMMTNELKSCVLTLPHHEQSNEHIDLDIRLAKPTQIDIEILNGTPFFSISIYPKASILSSGEGYDFTTNRSIQEIEEATNKYIVNIAKQYLYEISKE